jgi:hypothetical protein
MEILQKRVKKGPNSTLSELFVNGSRRGFVLEDKDRGLRSDMPLSEIMATKVHSETAIPTGRYRVQIRYSKNTFKAFMLWLRNVPGFEYIYYHKGNWIRNTRGCPLVGQSWGYDGGELCVHQSKNAYDPFYKEVINAIERQEEVWTTIVEAYDEPSQVDS